MCACTPVSLHGIPVVERTCVVLLRPYRNSTFNDQIIWREIDFCRTVVDARDCYRREDLLSETNPEPFSDRELGVMVSTAASVEASLVDEWVFSIQVPARTSSGRNTTKTTQEETSRDHLFQLRQCQPPHFSVAQDLSSPPEDDQLEQTASPGDTDVKEKQILLDNNSRGDSKSGTKESSTTSNPLGWTFKSPFWKITSNFVLQVTYRPAWQAIPEFTECRACASNTTAPKKKSNSFLRSVGSYCCGGGCGCRAGSYSDRIDFFTHTWTAADVVNVETLDLFSISGIGECQALRITLSSMPLSDDFPHRPPTYLATSWESHMQRIESSTLKPVVPEQLLTAPTVTFCLPLSQIDPPLLWKVQMPSLAEHVDIAVETYSIFDGKLSAAPEPTHIYINGFQSWSFAGSIVRGHEQPQPALPHAFSRAFGLGGSSPPDDTTVVSAKSAANSHAYDSVLNGISEPPTYMSDFFTCITADGTAPLEKEGKLLQDAVTRVGSSQTHLTPQPIIEEEAFPFQKLDETGGPAALFGWLAQRQQFGVITADRTLHRLAMHASADGTILPASTRFGGKASQQETDWAYVQLISPHSYDEEPMVHYLHAVAGHNHARPLQNGSLLTGWCSWYHYYNNITEKNLAENFKKLSEIRSSVPTNVAVVDDGYMTAWGDWDSLKPGKFGCMGKVARDIEENGMRPGLWLAPFAADKQSQLTSPNRNPEWVIHNDFGAPANSGNCGKFFYGLDATNPDVHEHVYEAIRRAVEDWKYNVLKIDFLYAACLEGNGKYNLTISRAQAMHMALATIREAAGPNVFLIGCGCPIASGIGYVDGMRISADTGPTWFPAPPLPWWDHGTLPCLRSMVRNSISRAPMGHRWWHNDPDCLLLGESTRLTDVEVASAASVVAMTCGMMLLSDDLTKISLSRTRILTKIFPMTGSSAVVLDLHSTNDGLPSLLRLWATDDHDEEFEIVDDTEGQLDYNREATFYGRKASFSLHKDSPPPNERKRSCLYAPKGLGSWTIISMSNWSEKPEVLHIPPPALLPPPLHGLGDHESDSFLDRKVEDSSEEDHGYHVLAFWSSRYSWLPPQKLSSEQPQSKRLDSHETEIFHIKRVSPEYPQYVGSDLHFSCCKEIFRFDATKNTVNMDLKTDFNRMGHVFVFLPVINTSNISVTVNGEAGRWMAVGNTPKVGENGSPRLVGRIIRIAVVVEAGPRAENGRITIQF